MPGLNQLKKFSADILQMGREPERRRVKGETIPRIPFPENASEADDSSQFVLGLPQEGDFSSETSDLTSIVPADPEQEEEIDIQALLANALGEQAPQPSASEPEPAPASGNTPVDDVFSADSFPSLDDDNIFGDLGDIGSSDGALDALAEFEADTSSLFSDPAIDALTAPEQAAPKPEAAADAGFEGFDSLDDFSLPDFGDAGTSGEDIASGFGDFSFGTEDVGTETTFESAGVSGFSSENDEFAISDDTQFIDMNSDIPERMKEGPAVTIDPFGGMGELNFGSVEDSVSDFELTDSQNAGSDFPEVPQVSEVPGSDDFNLDDILALSSDTNSGGFDKVAADDGAAGLDNIDISDFLGPDVSGGDASGGFDAAPVFEPSVPDEPASFDSFDDSAFSGASPLPADGANDFGMPEFDLGDGMPASMDDFDLPPVDDIDVMDLPEGVPTDDSDFVSGDDDFSIPGFSDFDMIPQDMGPARKEEKNTQRKKDEPVPLRTELTDSEYKTFLSNLDYYPLNVRIALQEMIVKNEFTDDAVMDVINKVIKKIPARQLASHLEKLLDVSLSVPINYEKRTAAEYEAYKQSLSYQLRNKIIPVAIASFFSLALCLLFGWLIAKFVVTPVKAEMLYKEGYELISNGLYPQSEQKFNEATVYKAKKKWFFTYARSYRDARQYDRAGSIYQRLLNRFDHDREAGLEYANMELYDRSNYARAEEIVRREILDYHIDDKDGMLLLGDVFLEWATNSDETKFDDALYAYEDLMYIHGQTDLHLSRMLRYYMRTDQIPKVLELKNYFYPKMQKKQVMENKDQVELSGYLLDKLYGYLSPKNEYLRAYIEDVRDLLEIAIKSCEKSNDMDAYPEAVYNYGRYFVETGNPDSAVTVLKRAVSLLEETPKKSHQRTLRTVNAYRLLGEIYSSSKKYLDAETMYAEGLTLYEYEKKNNALEPDENVGLLYADMADIDYFLSGDYDTALRNYEAAINNMNDTPSIRYRVGWIQYVNGNYSEALGSFIKVITDKPSEKNALFALANTLSFRNSTSAAAGYYEKLLDELDLEIQRADISLSRVQDVDQEELFTLYMKTTNNLGVALSQVASQTSDSRMNAQAISRFSNSIQAYDALHRNPETYVRLAGSNLAEMNLKYLTVPGSTYEPEYYSDLSRVLTDELMLRQADE